MLRHLKSLLTPPRTPPPSWRVPDGRRIYAVGDVHGRRDLFEVLIVRIEADHAARPPADIHIVLLGDLVDRGPDSAGVVAAAMALSGRLPTSLVSANHEEVLLAALDGNREALKMLIRIGGRETILSYGLSRDAYDRMDIEELAGRLQTLIPADHVAYLRTAVDHVVEGDCLFVHAGIRPGVALADQKSADLRWIRQEFLRHRGLHDHLVIHGHTVTDAVDLNPNRIGIDTGAYASGVLTAIGLEADTHWFLDTAAR